MDGAQNWDELFPWHAGQVAATAAHPAYGRLSAQVGVNPDLFSSTVLELCLAMAAEQIAGLCSIGSITQDLTWEGSLCTTITSTLCWHNYRAQHQNIPAPGHCWEEPQFLKASPNNHKSACSSTACSTSSHVVISSSGGLWGSYLSSAAAGLNCFLPLIKEIKVTKHRSSWNPCVKSFPWAMLSTDCIALPSLVKPSPLFFACCQSITVACTHWQALQRQICN